MNKPEDFPTNRKIGFHVSIAGGFSRAVGRAISLGCTTFQIFSRNPRSWRFKRREGEVKNFREKLNSSSIKPVFIHTFYLMNLSSPDETLRSRSIGILKEDIILARNMGIDAIVTHPGSGRFSKEIGIKMLLKSLEEVIPLLDEMGIYLLLENTAGSGMSIGSFDELINVVKVLGKPEKIGFCLDTCHAFVSGIDIGDEKALEGLMTSISSVGVDRLRLIHLNDSKAPFLSHVDIHEHIGKGYIGLDRFRIFLHYEPLSKIPIIMETPRRNDDDDLMNLKTVEKILRG